MNVEGSYVGQTQQPFHKRVNNHRHMFHKAPDKSPLAYHSLKAHDGTLNFDDFTFYILHQSKGTNLNRLESMYINKFRCRTLGLNSSNIVYEGEQGFKIFKNFLVVHLCRFIYFVINFIIKLGTKDALKLTRS